MRKVLGLFVCLLLAVVLSLGCTAAKKPEVNNNRNPVAEENQQAERIADTATQVEGVKSAYAVISGNMAVVGLNTDQGLKQNQIDTIKSEVGRRIAAMDRQITDVRISTDADTVERIRGISEGISQGKPVASFTQEIKDIVRRIAPTKES